jgi:hypothetical protein
MSAKAFTMLCIILVAADDLLADSPGKTKIIVGAALLEGGTILTIDAIKNFCLGDCPGRDVEAIAGLAAFGTGAVLLIWGLVDRAKAKEENSWIGNPEDGHFLIGVAPIENGVAGKVIFRW